MISSVRRCAAVALVGLPLVIAHAGTASAQVIDQRQEYYQARWDWKGVFKSTQDPNNISLIQFKSPTQAVYCYNKTCRTVKLEKGLGGNLTFSFNGKDYFEMNIVNSPRISGQFWTDTKPPARSPDAVATFVRKP